MQYKAGDERQRVVMVLHTSGTSGKKKVCSGSALRVIPQVNSAGRLRTIDN
jgi:hypothetical protein